MFGFITFVVAMGVGAIFYYLITSGKIIEMINDTTGN